MGGVEGFWPSGGGLRSAMLRSPLRVGCRVKGTTPRLPRGYGVVTRVVLNRE